MNYWKFSLSSLGLLLLLGCSEPKATGSQDAPENGWTDEEMDEIITQRKYIIGTSSFYLANEKLFFKLSGKREDFCMIDLKTDSLYAFDRLFDSFYSRRVNPFVGSDGTNLYLLVREKDLLEHYMNVKCTYPAIRDLRPVHRTQALPRTVSPLSKCKETAS